MGFHRLVKGSARRQSALYSVSRSIQLSDRDDNFQRKIGLNEVHT